MRIRARGSQIRAKPLVTPKFINLPGARCSAEEPGSRGACAPGFPTPGKEERASGTLPEVGLEEDAGGDR